MEKQTGKSDGMHDMWLSVAEIIQLMEAFSENDMGTLKLSNGDQALTLKACAQTSAACAPAPAPQQQIVTVQQNEAEAPAPVPEQSRGKVVTSPIVGTFYEAPAPDKDPFVRVGQQVNKGDVLFIIESMKLMNEVLSEHSGTVTELLAENGQAVEYGQPILRME